MIERVIELTIPPGFAQNGGLYQNRGRWVDGNFVRFHDGNARPIGGWERLKDANAVDVDQLNGCPRGMLAYRADDRILRIIVGTSTHLYAIVNGTVYDITPASFVSGQCGGTKNTGSGHIYGDDDYGSGPYGGYPFGSSIIDGDTWKLDVFGNYVVAVYTADQRVLVWDGDTSHVASALDDTPPVTGSTPTNNRSVVVTDERFLFVLGADANPRLVKWATQQTTDEWLAQTSSSAGDYTLVTPGVILNGMRGRGQTLIWTDVDMWAARYIGGLPVFSFERVGSECGLISPSAVGVKDSAAFWMGANGFFYFDGLNVRALGCDVLDKVFGDFNRTNRALVHCQPMSDFDEMWWFYPSATSSECNRYVIYNVREQTWATGQLSRATGVDKGSTEKPYLCDPDGILWVHEVGFDHSLGPGGSNAYISTGPIVLNDAGQRIRIQKVIPDEYQSGFAVTEMTMQILLRNYPTDDFQPAITVDLAGDKPRNVRGTGREAWFTFYEAFGSGRDWRIGTVRLGAIADSRR